MPRALEKAAGHPRASWIIPFSANIRDYLYSHDEVDQNYQRSEGLLWPKSTNDWMDRQHMYIDGMHRRQGRDG